MENIMYRKILSWPNPKLREKAVAVRAFDSGLADLEKDLIDTCNVDHGAGLASIQIGDPRSMVVLQPDIFGGTNPEPSKYNDKFLTLVNPNIISRSDETFKWQEGCLSVPGFTSNVCRNETIEVEFQTLDGRPMALRATGAWAGALQHEIDHLSGIVYVERISSLKRSMIRKKIMKRRKKEAKQRKNLTKHNY
jgi:peptide deformylase